MEKHFVKFYSPGTFVSEETTKEIPSYDVGIACGMAESIKERHGAKPFGFQFVTRTRTESELDSKETNRSNMYYLGGEILTLADVKARNDPDDSILISNMECNGWGKIIINTNSWKHTAVLRDGDIVIN